MRRFVFTEGDRRQMEAQGIDEARAIRQIEIFNRASFAVCLNRPCRIDDGVQNLLPDDMERYVQLHRAAAQKGRFSKFVPASGAASRMFQSLLQIYHVPHFLEYHELHQRAGRGVAIACDFLRFLNDLHKFAFFEDLARAISRDGHWLGGLVEDCQYYTLLEYLLTSRGLNYGFVPKALLKFHRYAMGSRTAFEEHLVETVDYLSHGAGCSRVHFTVPPEHKDGFARLWETARPVYEERYGIEYSVSFSCQRTSTDTIAVDMDDYPFRDRSGSLHFRPGGHGALLENLNDLDGDLVYIKNIDNVVQDRFKPAVAFWKQVLGGCLVWLQDRIHGYLRSMDERPSQTLTQDAAVFARDRLLIHFPPAYESWTVERKRQFVFNKLNRPIRVCGVVRNAGEPGGAPFWVEGEDGDLSLQIVEQAQVNLNDSEQKDIWMSSTHFNPVDLVCALKDYRGRPFNLRRFVDCNAVLISKKSKEGRDLKALELPGLWNGSMADWVTVFVEVPMITFNPVKTVFDLLRPEHQEGF